MVLDPKEFERALAACASEPIHQIGHVQPHGGLIAFSSDAPYRIHQVSANIGEFVGVDAPKLLTQNLASLFEPSALSRIEALISTLSEQPTASGKLPPAMGSAGRPLLLHLYRAGDSLVLEVEHDQAQNEQARLAELLLQTQQTMLRTDSYFDTCRYFDLLSQLVRSLTGYDSVMVYRFDPDWNGEVIAQSRAESAPSYLGMHFPASDIPAQARRLYTTNLVRIIADVDATPIPITPEYNPLTAQPLDLTYSALRSMSPIHIEYLRNIGVHASMVISLMQDDRLWGLIACHHFTPKPASMGLREAGIFISRLISTRLSGIEAMEQRRITDQANRIVGDLLKALPSSSVAEILPRLLPDLQQLMNASGMIVNVEGDIHVCGETPDPARIGQLLAWLGTKQTPELVATDFLSRDCPELTASADTMAGILATPPSDDMRNCIVWLRKEKLRTINWAGKYEEGFVQNAAGNFRLTPRKSFELWSESWSGRSDPWTPIELGVATTLALAIPESLSRKRLLEDALLAQQQTEAELREHRDHLEDLVRDRTLALSIAKEAAESASRTKTAFISTVSHELRTPMNGIMGLTNLALRRVDDPKLIDYLEKIDGSSQRLLSIINNMIDLSDTESQRLSLAPVRFELAEVIERVRNLATPRAAEKKLALIFDTPANLCPGALFADKDRLEQIVLALIDNAIKFTSAGSVTVCFRAEPADERQVLLRVEVRDTGIGISPASRAKVFNSFEQADSSATRRYGGVGLGLAICRRLAKMMNGEMGFDSQEGSGSTFWVQLRLETVPGTAERNP